ncbi:hypothetical protein ALC62_12432 [Cyphomyrmex costatus]|uniref:Uncharacterized protein n=1 Tax=Cyphomyrmex costatus TaxID=456900 RepID=A0A151IB46_9HYME|nr:hypothetical protein ALC62_12432 [Cyphomyrmex costatus]
MCAYDARKEQCLVNYCDNHCANQYSFRVNRIKNDLRDFCYKGEIDNKPRIIKIDTGSDISIVNDNFVEFDKPKIGIENCYVKYPTEEDQTTALLDPSVGHPDPPVHIPSVSPGASKLSKTIRQSQSSSSEWESPRKQPVTSPPYERFSVPQADENSNYWDPEKRTQTKPPLIYRERSLS